MLQVTVEDLLWLWVLFNWATPVGTVLLFAAYFSSQWFGVLCISLRSGASAGVVPILSNSRCDALLHLCHISVQTQGMVAVVNSSLSEHTSHGKLMLMHCPGSKRHTQSYYGPQGCFETLTENHYFWAVSGIYPYFQLFGSSWYVAYEGGQNGNSCTRNGSCWQNFLDIKSGYQLGESKGRTPTSLRVLGLLWKAEVAGTYSCNFPAVALTPLGGTLGGMSQSPTKRDLSVRGIKPSSDWIV